MIIYIFVALIILGVAAAFGEWRRGLYMVLIVGMLQDPVRKLTPEAPPIFVLSTLPIWFAIVLNAFGQEKRALILFSQYYIKLISRMKMFAITLMPAAVVMLMHGLFLWRVVVLGAFGYLAPVFAIIVGFVFSNDERQLLRLLSFYCFLVALMLSGTVMEYMHIFPEWQALGSSAMKMVWIKYVSFGHTIYMKCGFFRSPDIMGWHGAMMTMIALTLFFLNRSGILRWVWLVFVVWGVICIVISGRYKMVVMPMVWAVVFTIQICLYQGISRVIGFATIGVLVIVGMSMVSSKVGLLGTDYMLYAKSPLSYSVERLDQHGIGAVIVTYKQAGFWGSGLGYATQGTQHAGVIFKRGWQEGGLSKVMGELGVIGMVSFLLLVVSLATALTSNLRGESYKDGLFDLRAGLLSIAVANAAAFVVSAQVYSDLFVLSFLSMCIGFVLSGKRLREITV